MAAPANFVFVKAGGARLWVRRDLSAPPALDALLEADRLFTRPECALIKDQRKIKIGRIVLQLAGQALTVYLKRYNAFSWRYRWVSLLRRSGAYRSLEGAAILAQAKIETGAPLAAVEWRRGGMLERSFFLAEEIEAAKTADAYWLEDLRPIPGSEGIKRRRRFLCGLAELLDGLHARAIYHNDLKDANVLVRTDPANDQEGFFLLDLEGVHRCLYLSERRRIKNLVQLNRTLGRFLSRSQKLGALTAYLRCREGKRADVRRWVRRVERATARAELRSLAKRAGVLVRWS